MKIRHAISASNRASKHEMAASKRCLAVTLRCMWLSMVPDLMLRLTCAVKGGKAKPHSAQLLQFKGRSHRRRGAYSKSIIQIFDHPEIGDIFAFTEADMQRIKNR
jgi:hypothetical protein